MDFNLSTWFPVATSLDLPKRHVFQAKLLGREFAIWRADDNHVNVWENRCLHRGVKLSIGINNGSELKCQYHGWRYANRTAGCTYIPAHPADAPARTIRNNTYKCHEKYDMIWTCEDPQTDEPNLDGFENFTLLRPIPINASVDAIQVYLKKNGLKNHTFLPSQTQDEPSFSFKRKFNIKFLIQPMDTNMSCLRGIIDQNFQKKERRILIREYTWLINCARTQIEEKSTERHPKKQIDAKLPTLPPELTTMPPKKNTEIKTKLRVKIAEKKYLTKDIVKLRLESIDGQLPTFHPGAHIDVKLQNGLVRQYSLTNGPGETNHYSIAVKLEVDGKGGSKNIHESVSIGDILAISYPRNNFQLLRNSTHTIFLAAGIGITPILSMVKTLKTMQLGYELHYFVRSEHYGAFEGDLSKLNKPPKTYSNLSVAETLGAIKKILRTPKTATHVYVCGPSAFIKSTIEIGKKYGWGESRIKYEYFKNYKKVNRKTQFTIELARSALTLNVPSGKTILEVLRENKINIESSCEQGACGSCKATVLGGKIEHQDVYLNSEEKDKEDTILTCVSRAKSGRLILDL